MIQKTVINPIPPVTTQEVTNPTTPTVTTMEEAILQSQQATIQGATSRVIQAAMILETHILQTIKNIGKRINKKSNPDLIEVPSSSSYGALTSAQLSHLIRQQQSIINAGTLTSEELIDAQEVLKKALSEYAIRPYPKKPPGPIFDKPKPM